MTAARERVLAWEGCVNVRDLGGLPLEDGGATAFGVVVRADSIRALTERGRRALVDYGVRLAVDLRGDDELTDDPPWEPPVEVARFPMPGRELPVVWEWPTTVEAYRGLLAGFQAQFAGAVAAIARAQAPVVVHCQGGRDRTGLVCGLILRLVGVPLDAIAADHALSDESWAAHNERWQAEAPSEWERQRRRRITRPAGRAIAEVLAELDPARYLLAGGAATSDLDTIVVKLRA